MAVIGGLAGMRAVVTGGASGIGLACCELLKACGAEAWEVDAAGSRPLDVTDRAALENFAGELERLDILINAAGVLTENRPFDDQPVEDLRRNLEVNLIGTFTCCQVFAPLLRDGGGAVVNVSALAAMVGSAWQTSYTASKGGVMAFTRALAVDWAGTGVRVNAVVPGLTRTPMTAHFLAAPAFARRVQRRTPIGRVIEPHEVANAIVFLASPLASAITGIALPVDGGYLAGEPMAARE
jgi:NAD(P)-dependent dehydrogenase (short-subunit alcohol dehydrogenase family)